MDDIKKRLYNLLDTAEQQQQAVNAALAGLEQSKTDLTQAATALQTIGNQLTPAVGSAARDGAAQAVKTALENAGQTATDAVALACKPLLEKLAGVEQQAGAAEGKLKEAVKWFNWRWAGLAGATASGTILTIILGAWITVWWQRSELTNLKAERDQITAEVAAAKSTVAELDKRTGGVRYEESEKGRFIVVKKGYDASWTCENMPCIRLK